MGIDSSINRSLTAYLVEKSSTNTACPTSDPKVNVSEKVKTEEKDLTSKSKSKFERKGTKMSLFDFSDLDLAGFDNDQSSEESKRQIGRATIPVELPRLAH